MAVPRFLPTWLGGDCDRVDGHGAVLKTAAKPSGEPPKGKPAPVAGTGYTLSDFAISARSGGCYCTGECQRNPCHPCNGGIGGGARSTLQGWVCPKCGRSNAPWVFSCPCTAVTIPAAPKWQPCSCPPNTICNNTACPRRVHITCSTPS